MRDVSVCMSTYVATRGTACAFADLVATFEHQVSRFSIYSAFHLMNSTSLTHIILGPRDHSVTCILHVPYMHTLTQTMHAWLQQTMHACYRMDQ